MRGVYLNLKFCERIGMFHSYDTETCGLSVTM